MTTIVSTTGNNTCTIWADSAITSELVCHDINKLHTHKTWIIAGAGSLRMLNIVQHNINWPTPPKTLNGKSNTEWLAWIIKKVVPLIQSAITFHQPQSDNETLSNGELIIATHGRAWVIGNDYSVSETVPYWAVGSGTQLALGYLSATANQPDWHKLHHLAGKQAIETAALHDPYTRGKINGITTHHTGHLEYH